MKMNLIETTVKGCQVKRDAVTGRFLSVRTTKGVVRARTKSESAVKAASTKRSAALKRLANR